MTRPLLALLLTLAATALVVALAVWMALALN